METTTDIQKKFDYSGAAKYFDLCDKVVNQFPNLDISEAMSAAATALLDAYKKFTEDGKEGDLEGYIYISIKNKLLEYSRKRQREMKRTVSLEKHTGNTGNGITHDLAVDDSSFEILELLETYDELKQSLSEDDRIILEHRESYPDMPLVMMADILHKRYPNHKIPSKQPGLSKRIDKIYQRYLVMKE